jgi:hypothetical protein
VVYECHCSVDPSARSLVDHVRPGRSQARKLRGQVGDGEGQVVHAFAAPSQETAHRSVLRKRSDELHAPVFAEQQGDRFDALFLDPLARFDLRAEEPLIAPNGTFEVAHGDADVVDAERRHARIVPRAPPKGRSDAIMHTHSPPMGGGMDLFDKVKEKTSSALEQGKGLAHTQQLKLHLRKLDSELEDANTAFGAAAFDEWEAGTLSMSSDLGALAARVRDARAAHEAKKEEITQAGGDDDDVDLGTSDNGSDGPAASSN